MYFIVTVVHIVYIVYDINNEVKTMTAEVVSVRLDVELIKQLKTERVRKNRSMTYVVTEAITEYLLKKKRENKSMGCKNESKRNNGKNGTLHVPFFFIILRYAVHTHIKI